MKLKYFRLRDKANSRFIYQWVCGEFYGTAYLRAGTSEPGKRWLLTGSIRQLGTVKSKSFRIPLDYANRGMRLLETGLNELHDAGGLV